MTASAPESPDWVDTYFDHPRRAEAALDKLARAHPGWSFWRGGNRLWNARHGTWAADASSLTSAFPEDLGKLVSAAAEEGRG